MTAYRDDRDTRIAMLERDAKINEALIERLKAEKRQAKRYDGLPRWRFPIATGLLAANLTGLATSTVHPYDKMLGANAVALGLLTLLLGIRAVSERAP